MCTMPHPHYLILKYTLLHNHYLSLRLSEIPFYLLDAHSEAILAVPRWRWCIGSLNIECIVESLRMYPLLLGGRRILISIPFYSVVFGPVCKKEEIEGIQIVLFTMAFISLS